MRQTLRLARPMAGWRTDTIDNQSIALAHAIARLMRTRAYQERSAHLGSALVETTTIDSDYVPDAWKGYAVYVG